MATLRAAALLLFVALCGCSPFWIPSYDYDPFENPPHRKDENRTREYHLRLVCEELDTHAKSDYDRVLGEQTPLGQVIRPFADADFQVTVRTWNEDEQKVSLSIQIDDAPPTEMDLLFREVRIIPANGKKYSLGLQRRWRRNDGSLDFDIEDALY